MRALAPLVACSFALAAGCPAESPPPSGDVDGGVAPPSRPPFTVVDAGVDEHDAGPGAGCVDDDREDNDTQATATPVSDGESLAARFCGGDDDWYVINAPAADCAVALAVVAQTDASEGEGEGEADGAAPLDDLDLVVVGADGNVVGTASRLGAREALNVRVPRAGTYAVRVRGDGNADVAYTLSAAVTCGDEQVCPADDVYEDNDTAAAAGTLDRGVPIDAAVCGADVDLWQLPVQPGCIAEIEARFVDERGDVDLFVVERATGAERARSAGTSDVERVRVLLDDPSAYAARVILYNGSDTAAGNAYRLVVDQTCLGQLGCPGDDFDEDNDTRQTATPLGQDAAVLGVVCGIDEDFFRVTPQQGCTTTFFADFVHEDGDIDIELQDGSGTRITGSASSDDDEELRYVAPNNNAVVLRVFGFGDDQNRYRLTTTTSCP